SRQLRVSPANVHLLSPLRKQSVCCDVNIRDKKTVYEGCMMTILVKENICYSRAWERWPSEGVISREGPVF
ncbi:hypothetical protein, partial [Pseudomonas viridiflava]|uniref:hypothetical protein n=1 Tax=Pseudomonas viridiflava TaxID=33069 RepID=UPI0019821D1E